jgi:hypothetical protein
MIGYLLPVVTALTPIGLLSFTAHPLEWARLIALGIGLSAFIVLRAR